MKRIICAFLFILMSVVVLNAQEADKGGSSQKEKSDQEYIADLSSDKDLNTIVTAARWAGDEKEKDAIPNLVNLLTDSRWQVRMEVASSLGMIGEEDAVEALNKVMLKDERPEVRYAAVLATFRIGSKKSMEAWEQLKASEDDPFVKDILTKMEKKARGN